MIDAILIGRGERMAVEDGGSAFPRPISVDSASGISADSQDGMSLLDWFAGQALNGMVAANPVVDGVKPQESTKLLADTAYQLAHAMLKARTEEPA